MAKLVDKIELYRLPNPISGKEFSWRLLSNDGQEIAKSEIGYSQEEVWSKTKEILEEAWNAQLVYADPKDDPNKAQKEEGGERRTVDGSKSR